MHSLVHVQDHLVFGHLIYTPTQTDNNLEPIIKHSCVSHFSIIDILVVTLMKKIIFFKKKCMGTCDKPQICGKLLLGFVTLKVARLYSVCDVLFVLYTDFNTKILKLLKL